MIIGKSLTALGGGGLVASIFVKGLSETDTVTAINGSKTLNGNRITKSSVITSTVTEGIPIMTSNTAPSGKATCSTIYSVDYDAYKAFSGGEGQNAPYGWAPAASDSWGNAYCQYEFDEPVSPKSIGILTHGGTFYFTYRVIASLDGSSWDTLISSKYIGEKHKFIYTNVSTVSSYKYFRLILLSSNGGGINTSNGHKLQVLYDKEVQEIVEVTGFNISPIRELGTWTVTASDGKQTATQDVLVDVITEYEIEMSLTA